MTNVELLKVFHDVLLQAAKGIEAVLDDCDASEPDEAPEKKQNEPTTAPALADYDIRLLESMGLLDVHSTKVLFRAGFRTMRDFVQWVDSENAVRNMQGIGNSSFGKITNCIHNIGLKWKWEV